MLGSDCLAQRRETLLRRLAGRVHRDVSLSIEHGPAVEYTPQILHRLVVPGHGTGVTLRDYARHMLLGLGLEPRREAGGEQELIGSGFGNDASARSDHGTLVFFQRSLEAAPLIAPIAGLPVKEKDLRETGACLALDLAVELDKGRAQRLGELGAERGFARAAQPDERDPLHALVACAAVIADQLRTHRGERLPRQTLQELRRESQLHDVARVLSKELDEGEDESGCDLAQQHDRNAALSAFELREVALRHPRITGKQLA